MDRLQSGESETHHLDPCQRPPETSRGTPCQGSLCGSFVAAGPSTGSADGSRSSRWIDCNQVSRKPPPRPMPAPS